MKKFLLLCASAALMFCTACHDIDAPSSHKDFGALSIVIEDVDDAVTKASSTDALAYETKVSTVDVFVLSGTTVVRHETFSSISSLPYEAKVMGIPSGSYRVLVYGNAPSSAASATTMGAITGTAITLADCSLTNGFVMGVDCGNVTVNSGMETPVTATMQRFVSRVRLKSVTNGVPSGYASSGAITVKGAYLINVPTAWDLTGLVANVSSWGNLAGRNAAGSAMITANSQVNPSAYAAHLAKFQSVAIANGAANSTSFGWNLYAFPSPNAASASDLFGAAPLSAPSMTACPRLVVVATVNGRDCFYPVTLVSGGATLARNTSYDVSLTILGVGSSDPNEPVITSESVIATVTVVDGGGWTAGNNYNEPL